MIRAFFSLMLCLLVLPAVGCRMCQDTFFDAYPAYGSVRPRTDQFCGRVGSVIAPADDVATAQEGVAREGEPVIVDEGKGGTILKSESPDSVPAPDAEATTESGLTPE